MAAHDPPFLVAVSENEALLNCCMAWNGVLGYCGTQHLAAQHSDDMANAVPEGIVTLLLAIVLAVQERFGGL